MYQNQSINLQVKQVIGLQSTKQKMLKGCLQSTIILIIQSTIYNQIFGQIYNKTKTPPKDEGWLVKSEGLRVLDPNFAQNIHQTEINFGWIYNLKWRDILSTDLNKIGEEEKYLQVYTFFYLYSTSFPVQNYHLEFKCFNHLWSTIYNENKGQIYNLQSSVSGYN